jgi:hypothetical protein
MLPEDSSSGKLICDFRKDGAFLHYYDGSAKIDSSRYEWGAKNELGIKESLKDSVSEIYLVKKLGADSLMLQSKDSIVMALSRLK